ncbi:ATP-binding protein [Acidithiobacillus sulfuriphilus]|uniref:ATP-binding protein n=1 Tax=Acidithiobacillus sulfuriphilus TaxID=1867749 RepID=UPI003F5E4A40
MDEKIFRVFVSSPGDAAAERQRVRLVVERLNGEFEGRARFLPKFWEDQIYSAHATFQAQIVEAAECDVVLAIFRARLGTPLPEDWPKVPGTDQPYPSGSAYEVLTATEARRSGKPLPDVYVFRYKEAPNPSLDAADRRAIETEWERLKGFFDTWFKSPSGEFIAAFQWYQSTDDLAQQTEKCLRNWLADRGILSEGPVWDRVLNGCPFPGLAAFDADRRSVFFGRSTTIKSGVSRLRQAKLPFLLLIGASGSGKSSLLRAGLVPKLVTPSIIPEVELWRAAIMTTDGDPFAQLAQCLLMETALGPELQQGAFGTPELLAKQLRTDLDTATLPLQEALDRAANAQRETVKSDTKPHARLLLGIDQTERWFMENIPSGTIHAFAALLGAWVEQSLVTLILTLRSDAYTGFQNVPALLRLRESGATLDLVPPTSAELEEMITQPVADCSPPLVFGECDGGQSLASRLVADAQGGDVLPLLQMTLVRLYEAEETRKDGKLSCDDYHGMEEAVTEAADSAMEKLSPSEREPLDLLILGMIDNVSLDALSGKWQPIIKPLPRVTFARDNPGATKLLDALIDARLLVTEEGPQGSQVRPVHEALLRIWPKAQGIVQAYAEQIHLRTMLAARVSAWEEAPDSAKEDYLQLPELEKEAFKELQRNFSTLLPESSQRFLRQVNMREERFQRQLIHRQNLFFALAYVLATSTGVLQFIALQKIDIIQLLSEPISFRYDFVGGIFIGVFLMLSYSSFIYEKALQWIARINIGFKTAFYLIAITAIFANGFIFTVAILRWGPIQSIQMEFIEDSFYAAFLALITKQLIDNTRHESVKFKDIVFSAVVLVIAQLPFVLILSLMHH